MFKKFLVITFISMLVIHCLQVRGLSFELEGKGIQKNITILKRDLASQDVEKKKNAILSLGKLGGKTVPVLLKQLTIELKKKEKVVLGGKLKERTSRFAGYIILSLGHTVDRRSIQPLIDIALSDNFSVDLRWDAIRVLTVLAGATPSSRFLPQAEPSKGQEVTSEDRAKIEQTFAILLGSKHDVLRDEAKRALKRIKRPRSRESAE